MLDEYYAVETNFRKLSFPEYYLTLHDFADALDGNEFFNSGRPECVPDGKKFREHVAVMKELGVGAERGDSLHKDQRQTVRDLSEVDMDASVSYMRILAISKKDPTVLHALGCRSRTTTKRASASPPHRKLPRYIRRSNI